MATESGGWASGHILDESVHLWHKVIVGILSELVVQLEVLQGESGFPKASSLLLRLLQTANVG